MAEHAKHAEQQWWQRREFQIGGAAAAVLAVVLGFVAFGGGGGDDSPEPLAALEPDEPTATAVPSTLAPDADEPPTVRSGTVADLLDDRPLSATLTDLDDRRPPVAIRELGPGWDEMAEAPIEPRTDAVAVWTESEVVVWGGRADSVLDDGAAYDPATDTWRELSPSPLSARSNAAAVWAGTELLVVGGLDDDGQRLNSSAAYDPATDEWRLMDWGITGTDTTLGLAWTEDVVVVAGAADNQSSLVSDAFVYDPQSDALTDIEPVPERGVDVARALFADDAGGVYLLQSDADSNEVAFDYFDLLSEEWLRDDPVPGIKALDLDPRAVAWTGEVFLLAVHYTDGAIYDPISGEATPIPGSRSNVRWPAVMFEGHVFYGDLRFDPETDTWLSDVAYPFPDPEFPMVVGMDDGVFVWGGSSCGRGAGCSDFIGEQQGLIWSEPTTDPDGLLPPVSCIGGVLFEETADIDQPIDGFRAREDADAYWWTAGAGGDRGDRLDLRREVGGDFVIFSGDDGTPVVVLRVEQTNNAWFIVASSECRR